MVASAVSAAAAAVVVAVAVAVAAAMALRRRTDGTWRAAPMESGWWAAAKPEPEP